MNPLLIQLIFLTILRDKKRKTAPKSQYSTYELAKAYKKFISMVKT